MDEKQLNIPISVSASTDADADGLPPPLPPLPPLPPPPEDAEANGLPPTDKDANDPLPEAEAAKPAAAQNNELDDYDVSGLFNGDVDFDADPDTFDRDTLECGRLLAKDVGFDPRHVSINRRKGVPGPLLGEMLKYQITFDINGRVYNNTGGGDTRLKNKLLFGPAAAHLLNGFRWGKDNGFFPGDNFDLTPLVPQEAIDDANLMNYPKGKFALVQRMKQTEGSRATPWLVVCILCLATGFHASGSDSAHNKMCLERGLEYSSIKSQDMIKNMIRAMGFGLPYGWNVKERADKNRSIRPTSPTGKKYTNLSSALLDTRVMQQDYQREVLKKLTKLLGYNYAKVTNEIASFGDFCHRVNVRRFMIGESDMSYPNSKTILKYLEHSATLEEINGHPDLAGLLFALFNRVRRGDHLPDDVDEHLRQASIGHISGGGVEMGVEKKRKRSNDDIGLVFDDTDDVEDARSSYSEVKPNTLVAVKIRALAHFDDTRLDPSDEGWMIVQYHHCGVDEIGQYVVELSVPVNGDGTEDEEDRFYYLIAEKVEDLKDVVEQNLRIFSSPGQLFTFSDESKMKKKLASFQAPAAFVGESVGV